MLMSVNITYIENFPSIGTIEDPAYAWINGKLLLSYQIAPVDGGGCALLLFKDVSDASIFPLNVEGISENKSGPYVPCLLYTSPSPRDKRQSRMPSSA